MIEIKFGKTCFTFENKISTESPIGKAIMNKKVGDVISVDSPTGSYEIKIVKIA